MRIISVKDYQEMSRAAASLIAAQVLGKPDSVLGLATGSSPIGAYQKLIEWHKAGALDFSACSTANLDEYVGLTKDNDQSYAYFMRQNLFDHINIPAERLNIPDGTNPNAAAECARYDKVIEELGGIDLQLLGIGRNGHIGFNEPGDCFVKETHVVDLAESTIDANARFFASRDDVPKQAISMGMGAIMGAKKVLLCASGEEKADAICGSVLGAISPSCPASILQLHPDVIVVVDEAAFSKLAAAGFQA